MKCKLANQCRGGHQRVESNCGFVLLMDLFLSFRGCLALLLRYLKKKESNNKINYTWIKLGDD